MRRVQIGKSSPIVGTQLIAARSVRKAFTLVEMMVAVALVLLMMALFAEIFSVATSSMSRMKGLAENDQRARMVATLMTSDFRKRTFRSVVPFTPVNFPGVLTTPLGYLEYSENEPTDDTDDVLRLTIDTRHTEQDLEADRFLLFGKTTQLANVTANPNQPEGDDGNYSGEDKTGQSVAAEVVWFLRKGNLYRRLLLIRKPYRNDAGITTDPTFGNPPTNNPMIAGPYTFGTGNFYTDFDYSAIYNTSLNRTQFHDFSSLEPAVGSGGYNLGLAFPVPKSLSIPHLRFGHSLNIPAGSPREFTDVVDGKGDFIGSFTQEETSNQGFQFPGTNMTGPNDPYTRPLTLDNVDPVSGLTTGWAVKEYRGGSRMGEDLLLSNVLSFDIKIWDEAAGNGPDGQPGFAGIDDDNDGGIDNKLNERGAVVPPNGGLDRGSQCDDGDFVDLGHGGFPGYYSRAPGDQNGNGTGYGNRFDTWSAAQALAAIGGPPYQAMRFVPNGTRAATNFPFRVRARWQPNNNYVVGDIVLPNAILGPTPANPYAFRCISAGTSGMTEPSWQMGDYAQTAENPQPPPMSPLGPYWEAIPNMIGVKALRIQIRYLDISSGLVKDLTLVHSLRDVL